MDSTITALYSYRICTDRRTDEDGTIILVYGIEVYESNSTTPLLVMNDLFTQRSQAEELAELCNRLELDPIHLSDVVEDWLTTY